MDEALAKLRAAADEINRARIREAGGLTDDVRSSIAEFDAVITFMSEAAEAKGLCLTPLPSQFLAAHEDDEDLDPLR
jgi:hypothetical protein